MDRRLLTFDSFSSDSCKTACSVESCLQPKELHQNTQPKLEATVLNLTVQGLKLPKPLLGLQLNCFLKTRI